MHSQLSSSPAAPHQVEARQLQQRQHWPPVELRVVCHDRTQSLGLAPAHMNMDIQVAHENVMFMQACT
jgi:hypothetical protein